MKKIAVGDIGEFWYGDYKEPFEQLEGGVPGHPVGVVLKADDGRLLCAWCGKTFDNLATHINKTHHSSAASYKETVGLLHKSALKSDRLRLVGARNGLRHGFGPHPEHSYSRPSMVTRRSGAEHHSLNPERLNKTGTCYAQALAVGRTVTRETGRLSQKTLRKHGISPIIVARYFGDMDGFRRAVGLAPVNKRKSLSNSDLISVLRHLSQDLGRTPLGTDMRRYGMPSRNTYIKRFGSWSSACIQAGLTPNLPIPDGQDFDVNVLVAYATLGTIMKVAHHLHVAASRVTETMTRYGAPFPDMNYNGPDTTARRRWAADMAQRLAGVVAAA